VKRFSFILFFVLTLFVHAQEFGVGMKISGFRVPDYDEKGNLRAQLYGERAVVLEEKKVEIFNLKIEMYKEGKVVMTVFAPHCFFDMEKRKAYSDGRVLIESGMMTIIGTGFIWSSEANRFEILHESKVLVKKAAQKDIKGLKL